MTTLAPMQASPTRLERRDYAMDDLPNTPTTPRAIQHPGQALEPQAPVSQQQTPYGGMEAQRPLPTSPFPGSATPERPDGGMQRGSSQRSVVSSNPDSMDVDDSGDEQNASGDETEGGKSSKRKKGQRFFCTDFPPCNLSFTRSEHLARHIRKHTGERPFQCHCNRRFSRLDNLRQHAQTVHVNEDIPGDSLAATGTRFQRQIRTDRVRPPGGRARSSTVGSQGSHSRGHSRNLSTSSISSAVSSYSNAPEPRRRPPPLMMAGDPSRGQAVEPTSSPKTPTSQYAQYAAESPGGYSTPTSTAYSTGPGSPNTGPHYSSPGRGLFAGPPPTRRLSVPSTGHPFVPGHSHSHSQPYLSPHTPSSTAYSNNSSLLTSPTSSTFSYSRADPTSAADAEWRRRTWHPTTYSYSGNVNSYGRPATSGLSYSQTPDAPQPHFTPNATAAAGPAPRLPGIESFDQVQHRPSTPPRRQPSPMHVDPRGQQGGFNPPPAPPPMSALRSHPSGPHHSRAHVSWDLGLHSTMNRLDLGGSPRDTSSWGRQTINEIQQAGSRPPPLSQPLSGSYGQPNHDSSHDAQPTTPTRNKRMGWYNGPPLLSSQGPAVARTSPEDSSSSEGVPTPGTSNPEYRPAIVHHDGYIEHHHPPGSSDGSSGPCAPPLSHNQPPYSSQQGGQPGPAYYNAPTPPRSQQDLGRLEALVAVATSENNSVSAAR